jgi:hypothetical protein
VYSGVSNNWYCSGSSATAGLGFFFVAKGDEPISFSPAFRLVVKLAFAIGIGVDSSMEICQLLIQARLVVLPRHAIDSGRSFSLQGVVAVPQKTDRDMVKQRGESAGRRNLR